MSVDAQFIASVRPLPSGAIDPPRPCVPVQARCSGGDASAVQRRSTSGSSPPRWEGKCPGRDTHN